MSVDLERLGYSILGPGGVVECVSLGCSLVYLSYWTTITVSDIRSVFRSSVMDNSCRYRHTGRFREALSLSVSRSMASAVFRLGRATAVGIFLLFG